MYLMNDITSGSVSGKALASLLETTRAHGLATSRQMRTLDRSCLRWLSEVKTYFAFVSWVSFRTLGCEVGACSSLGLHIASKKESSPS